MMKENEPVPPTTILLPKASSSVSDNKKQTRSGSLYISNRIISTVSNENHKQLQ
jgi:hypothetical protein